jgi:hypothetical protein
MYSTPVTMIAIAPTPIANAARKFFDIRGCSRSA